MTKQLSFNVEYVYPDHPDGITVTVSLGYGDKVIITDAKIDTGAAYCLFRHEHGRELGIPVELGTPSTMTTLGGPLEAFGHEVTIESCGLVFQSFVYFAKYPGLPRNLLGRVGWLRNLRLALIDYDNTIYLNSYDD